MQMDAQQEARDQPAADTDSKVTSRPQLSLTSMEEEGLAHGKMQAALARRSGLPLAQDSEHVEEPGGLLSPSAYAQQRRQRVLYRDEQLHLLVRLPRGLAAAIE